MLQTGFHREVATTSEAASFLSVGRATIERACRRGDIPAERVEGRWLIRREDLLKATDPAITPAARSDLRDRTVKGTPRKRRPVIRSSRAKR